MHDLHLRGIFRVEYKDSANKIIMEKYLALLYSRIKICFLHCLRMINALLYFNIVYALLIHWHVQVQSRIIR